ncbi:MAG TPA: hypothetical protein VNZ54_09040 [bacterium]|nr:hypothetical protein [bacterium]
MFRRGLKSFGAALALAGILFLHLHVLQHVFGADRDADGPCQACQLALSQVALQAADPVDAPRLTQIFFVTPRPEPAPLVRSLDRGTDARGPPILIFT